MAATSIMGLVGSASLDLATGRYNALIFWTDSEGIQGIVDVLFDLTETAPVVNNRCINAMKDDHNTKLGTSFNAATPSALFGGMN